MTQLARLSREFYLGDTVEIAQKLLGKYLVRVLDGETLACRITETEAYVGRCDRACHAYGYRRTARNAVMFGPPGHAYLYLIYGMHCCLNFVTEPEGEPSAVLLRGAEAAAGMDTIRRLRYGSTDTLTAYQQKNFLNGPGKVCKALSLSRSQNGLDLTGNELFLCSDLGDAGVPSPDPGPKRGQICSGPRIGVDYAGADSALPWRFWLTKEN